MSLFDFPPLNTERRPYAIQEFNGKVLTGTEEEFLAVNKCRILFDYPSIDRTQLSSLRHCISKENMKNVFARGDGGLLDSAWNQLTSEGFSGVVKRVADAAEPTRLWPIAKLGRGVLKVHNGVSSIAAKVLMGKGALPVEEVMETYGTTLDWKKNWIRCIALHPAGSRLALCQPDDYIRVYNIGAGESKTPITLKHERQVNVTCMNWEPHNQRVLAVASGGNIIIWKLANKSMNIRPSAECTKIIETNLPSLTHLIWDKRSSRGLLAASPDSNRVLAIDTLNQEIEYLNSSWAWGTGNPVRLIPTGDGDRIAVLYTSNTMRVYNRLTWDCEKFTGLKGRVIDAVWSPASDVLIFATENSNHLQAVSFVHTTDTSIDGKTDSRWLSNSAPRQIFDFSPVEFDSTETELEGGEERPIIEIGGRVQKLALSPDGKRLVASFKQFSVVVAVFSVDWKPSVTLTPHALIEAPNFGSASLISFWPKFNEGSLLSIVWSDGYAQYLPFIYSPNTSMIIRTTNILDEISATSSALGNRSTKRRSLDSSLNESVELPSGICDRSEEQEEELMTERVKRIRPE